MTAGTLRLAHRGDHRHAPENSLAAFAAALAIPACDGLEFDVQRSLDGVPVICHDETLARTHGRPERIDRMTAAALGALGVPTLAEVLEAVGRGPFLDVELKGDPGPIVVEILSAWRGATLSRAVVSSFEAGSLTRVRRLAPAWPCWLNTYTLDTAVIDEAVALGCRGVAVEWQALDQPSVMAAQAAGLEVAAWTVRRCPTFDRLARFGLVAACVEAAALDGGSTGHDGAGDG